MSALSTRSWAALIVVPLLNAPALAGRPLVVDDANTDDKGSGHLETWATHAGGSTQFNVAPAYAPFDGLEFGALLQREPRASATVTALQAKWRITPSRGQGCNLGAVLGFSRASASSGMSDHAGWVNALLTCNLADAGSLHLNLGALKPSRRSAESNWGVAYELPWAGVTPHVEWFGSEGVKPTAQAGARGEIAKGLQLDGSVGRSHGATITTLGLKLQF